MAVFWSMKFSLAPELMRADRANFHGKWRARMPPATGELSLDTKPRNTVCLYNRDTVSGFTDSVHSLRLRWVCPSFMDSSWGEVSVQDQKGWEDSCICGQRHHSTWVLPKLPYFTLRRLVAPLLLPVVDLDSQYHQGLKTWLSLIS